MAAFFVLLPLFAYIPMFAYETYIAFRRIGRPKDAGGEYLHATWEVTHTFLILSLNYFVWLYSSAVVTVGRAVFLPLLLFGLSFIFRAVIYTYLFYIKSGSKPNLAADVLFAMTHLSMIVSLGFVVIRAGMIMHGGGFEPNVLLPALLWPGVAMMVPLISLPLYFLYRTSSR